MGHMSRNGRRAIADRCIDVYAADTSRGWRVVRQVTPLYAYDKVALGKWHELFDDFGNFYGVQVVAAVRCDMDLMSDEDSATTITASESKQNAGLDGPSMTFGQSEDFRIDRHHPITGTAQPPEDWIERAQQKVKEWPFPASRIDNGRDPLPTKIYSRVGEYGDRALRVYPPALPK